jgi:hypothetical protein
MGNIVQGNVIFTTQQEQIMTLKLQLKESQLYGLNMGLAYDNCREEVIEADKIADKLLENNEHLRSIIKQKDIQVKAIGGLTALLVIYNVIQIVKK